MKTILLLLAALFTQSCSMAKTNEQEFISYLNDGYTKTAEVYNNVPMIFGFILKRKETCIYGDAPNAASKHAIDMLYNLIVHEFEELKLPSYVASIEECPSDTSIFVFLHSTLNSPNKQLTRERGKAYDFSKTPITKKDRSHWLRHNGVGSTSVIKGSRGKSFVEINQFSDLIKIDRMYEKIAKSVALEELFQSISTGKDLSNRKKIMSKLHEPSVTESKRKEEPSTFSKEVIGDNQYKLYFEDYGLALKPQGLCSFDLWFLILSDMAKSKNSFYYRDYVELFKKNQAQIIDRASKIETTLGYKELFDSRCSGKNAGVNTRINSPS